ncbi:hypothetical protein [Methylibium sp.]|uniref:hypothetical protein n=1 Tax=Methylibium sp. TaxID=2067992 RepID=UPI0017B3ABE1|nr:hypothetical protein [Methylibium sp.]MBA3590469.1 hypothetical protein [Methylibium sp.]
MVFTQLIGRYRRLQQDLAISYEARPWHSGRIDRLADELAETERQLAVMAPLDEQGVAIQADWRKR